MNYFLSLKWKKPKYVKIIFTLMDVSHLYKEEEEKKKKDENAEKVNFTMRQRGKSMVKLDDTL